MQEAVAVASNQGDNGWLDNMRLGCDQRAARLSQDRTATSMGAGNDRSNSTVAGSGKDDGGLDDGERRTTAACVGL